MVTKITITSAESKLLTTVRKRDGKLVPFDVDKISKAVLKALQVTSEGGQKQADWIAKKIFKDILKLRKASHQENFIPTVEMVQDLVEEELMLQDFVKTAKAYILYREERAQVRKNVATVPARVQKLADESKKYFRNTLAELVYYRSYSRWIDDEGRRETWIETVDRYMNFMKENLGEKLSDGEAKEVREAILNQEAMPSMRLFQFAGGPARVTNVCAYNCSYTAPRSVQDLAEIIYISMCGTGVGFSVESRNVQAFPQIEIQGGEKLPTHLIDDSKEGWADAFALGMKTWVEGNDIDFDFSSLRPAGARLKTMGGKSSGPDPLRALLTFTREKVLKRQGKRLRNIDLHDIICKIGECVVAGGVRRSALISLSDIDDTEVRDAKSGQFGTTEPQRSLANNSAVYEVKPDNVEFMNEWFALAKSGSGERGIFNRGSLVDTLPARRLAKLKAGEHPQWGTNPCGEIILRPKQFCNLSEVVARAEDTEESLLRKIRVATILGTYQSTLTKFPYLSKEWKKNCEEERLLGVSITGQWDSK